MLVESRGSGVVLVVLFMVVVYVVVLVMVVRIVGVVVLSCSRGAAFVVVRAVVMGLVLVGCDL